MLTVGDVQAVRLDRARTNHETYKIVLQRVYDRIRHRTSLNGTDLTYAVPPFVPGRPVYDPSHAARYVTEKLRRGGFAVTADGSSLVVDWSLPATKATARKVAGKKAPAATPAATPKTADGQTRGRGLSERLEALKARLKF
jgi:hypothetical protein